MNSLIICLWYKQLFIIFERGVWYSMNSNQKNIKHICYCLIIVFALIIMNLSTIYATELTPKIELLKQYHFESVETSSSVTIPHIIGLDNPQI